MHTFSFKKSTWKGRLEMATICLGLNVVDTNITQALS